MNFIEVPFLARARRREQAPLFFAIALAAGSWINGGSQLFAQDAVRASRASSSASEAPYRSPSELKQLPLEQLLNVEITSASRRPEPISQAASAIDVVSGETIRRAGVNSIPDALRLAAGVEVAQIDGHSWAISSRGFDISAANKLQVLLDGRSLYTPLFSGVFWDVQRTFLPDLEQIEVIRGPGATLWGANAVNGVINIRSKSAKDTQGWLLDGGAGDEEGYLGVRYGGRIAKDTYYRAYVMHQSHDSLSLMGGGDADDETRFTQGGFRIDSQLSPEDTLTIQGDGYAGTFGQFQMPDIDVDGGNAIVRWARELAPDSTISLQAYYDRTHRLIPNVFEEHRNTFDLELEGRFLAGQHDIVYGAEYRLSHDEIGNLGPLLAFIPDHDTEHLLSTYVQDEWHILPGKFSLIVGSKLEYNTFSDFEIQPTGRFVWNPRTNQTVWGAISRAVRTPTRIDQDLVAPNPATGQQPFLQANRGFDSEDLIAYELGYRVRPSSTLSLDLSTFYNDYDNLRSQEVGGPNGFPIVLGNKLEGETYGATLTTKWRVTDWWTLDGSVTGLQVDLHRSPGGADRSNGIAEANDPDVMFTLHSAFDLPGRVQFDAVLRYVDDLPHPETPSYLTCDLRLAWSPRKNLEVAIVGRDLFDEAHPEFAGAVTREVRRSVFATLKWSY